MERIGTAGALAVCFPSSCGGIGSGVSRTALHEPIKFNVADGWKLDAYGTEDPKQKGPDGKTRWTDVYRFTYQDEIPDEAKLCSGDEEERVYFQV